MASSVALALTPTVSRAATVTQVGAPVSPDPLNRVERAVTDSIAAHGVPGAAVAIMTAGSQVVSLGRGQANLETATPITPHSVFRIGSLTKQFTAAAILRMAAAGQLDLYAPVSDYLASFSPLAPFSILEALHQTAGLHSDESEVSLAAQIRLPDQVSLADQIAAQSQPFDFEPGTAWLYSNANYIVLGAVIERVTGQPFQAAMAGLIFEPLGLSLTAVDTAAEIVVGRASGYAPTGEESHPYVNAAWLDPLQAGGAGSMRSTVGDLCNWHQLLLSNALFDQSHTELMLAPGRLRDGRLSSANRFSADDAHYGDTEYACGLLVSGPSQAHPNLLHYGAINGFCAVLQTWTEPQVTFACLCNGDIGPGVPFRSVRRAVVEGWVGG